NFLSFIPQYTIFLALYRHLLCALASRVSLSQLLGLWFAYYGDTTAYFARVKSGYLAVLVRTPMPLSGDIQ
ncbi:hypothetical protein FB45DRAFT_906135, partial [Roridomyces roridus]